MTISTYHFTRKFVIFFLKYRQKVLVLYSKM